MNDVTRILSAIEKGDPAAAEQLVPLVYEELRKLAAQRLANEKPGQTFQATALVHEAYVRLVDVEKAQHWNSRGHFFGAAAEAMRRILVERARHKRSLKAGGDRHRQDLSDVDLATVEPDIDLLALNEALEKLENQDMQGRGRQAAFLRRADDRTGGAGTRYFHLNCRKRLDLCPLLAPPRNRSGRR